MNKKIIMRVLLGVILSIIMYTISSHYILKEFNKVTTLENVDKELVSRGWDSDIKSKKLIYDNKRGVYDVDVRYKSLANEVYSYSIVAKDRQTKKDLINYYLKGKEFKGRVYGSGYCDEDKECNNYLDNDDSIGIVTTREID